MRTYPILTNTGEVEREGVAFLIPGLIGKNCFKRVLSNLPDFKRTEKIVNGSEDTKVEKN